MTQPPLSESPTYGSQEQDPLSPIKPLSLSFAMSPPGQEPLTSPESKEVPLMATKRTRNRGPLSPTSPGSDGLMAMSPKAITKMKISPSPPQPPISSISSPSSPIYPVTSLFPSNSSPTSPALAPMTLGLTGSPGPSPKLRPLEMPFSSQKLRPVLTIVTQDDFRDPMASLIGEELQGPETAPPFMFGPSAPPSPRSKELPPRPKSTTAADTLRKFNFPELEEEIPNDDEFVNRRSQLQRSASVSGRMEPDPATPLGDLPVGEGLLPSIDPGGSCCGIKRVSVETTAALLRGEFRSTIDRYLIADCRYDYEYIGGHILSAANTNTRHTVESLFEMNREGSSKVVVVFHCEFSKHRGPNCCRHFRQFDRESNTYPKLTFPELYVMDGGYRGFYQKFPELCVPNSYVSMWDPKYSKECKERHKEFKKSWATKTSKRGGGRLGREREIVRGNGGAGTRRSLSRGRRLESIEDSGSPDAQAARENSQSSIYGRSQKRKTGDIMQPSSSPSTAFPTPSGSPRSLGKSSSGSGSSSSSSSVSVSLLEMDKENRYFDSNSGHDRQASSISPQFASLRLRSKSSPAGPSFTSFPFGFPKSTSIPTPEMDTDTISLSEPMQLESEDLPTTSTRLPETNSSGSTSGSAHWNFLSRSRH